MKLPYQRILIIVLLHICFLPIYSQTASSEGLIAKLSDYASNYSPEKVYIHSDKTKYLIGDTLWYKAYVVDAVYHYPVMVNTVMYVELFDQIGELVFRHQLISSENSSANGDFVISNDLNPGKYSLRAYTRSMMNWSDCFFFEKTIVIEDFKQMLVKANSVNVDSSSYFAIQDTSLRLFPEGGELVNGLQSRVAAELTGLDVDFNDVKGYVVDRNDSIISTFKFYERGLGQFYIQANTSEKSKVYAIVGQDTIKAELPQIKEFGFIINLTQRKDNIILEVKHNYKNNNEAYVIAHQRGSLCWNTALVFDEYNSFIRILPVDSMMAGITHFTIFNSEGNPVVERLIYVDKGFPTADIRVDSNDIKANSEIDLNLLIKRSEVAQNEEVYNCSISIYNEEFESKSEEDIRTFFLLNSDLHGEINDPAYFFREEDRFRRLYLLDLVMMTHGWRRFTWQDLNRVDAFDSLAYSNDAGIIIKGYTASVVNKEKRIPSKVILNIMDQNFFEEEIMTDEEGNFQFGPFVTLDTFNAFLQARRIKSSKDQGKLEGNRNVMIYLSQPQFATYEPKKEIEYIKDKLVVLNPSTLSELSSARYLREKFDNMMNIELDEFVVTGKALTKNDSLNEIKDRLSIYSEPSTRLIIDDNEARGIQSVFDLLRRVAGVSVNGSPPNQSASIRGVASLNASTTPLYLVNGMPVDESYVNTLSPGEIIFIDVLKDGRAAIFGQRGANGVIAVYTGFRSGSSNESLPGIINFTLNGFYNAKEFHSPKLSSEYEIPDIRTTIYWNPNLQMRPNQAQEIKFITSRIKANYRIVLQGVSNFGNLLFSTSSFQAN